MKDTHPEGYSTFDANAFPPDSPAASSPALPRRKATQAPKDERKVARRVRSFLHTHLHGTASGRPLPGYLRALVESLQNTPREPLVRAVVALHLTRVSNGRVFVLTDEERSGNASRLVWDLRREDVRAVLVSARAPESAASMRPEHVEGTLRRGDVVLVLDCTPQTRETIHGVARQAEALLVTLGPDASDRETCAIAATDDCHMRLLMSHLLCTALRDLADGSATRLRNVS